MGLKFIDTILSLLTAACGVFVAYLVGHALSAHAGMAWILAGIFLVVTLALGAFTLRRLRGYPSRFDTHTHSHSH